MRQFSRARLHPPKIFDPTPVGESAQIPQAPQSRPHEREEGMSKKIGFFGWAWRLLFGDPPEAPHECEEFTQWSDCSANVLIVADANGNRLPDERQYELVRYWQERRCTICGWLEQRPLTYQGDDDDDA
jgi:hypothetical protein